MRLRWITGMLDKVADAWRDYRLDQQRYATLRKEQVRRIEERNREDEPNTFLKDL